jgi:hypothetical protein
MNTRRRSPAHRTLGLAALLLCIVLGACRRAGDGRAEVYGGFGAVLRGRVTAIGAETETVLCNAGFRRIDVLGATPAESGHFSLLLEPAAAAPLPFAVGDVISARLIALPRGQTTIYDAVVTDASGALLLALSNRGDATLAPGWAFSVAPHPGNTSNAPRVYPVTLGHNGRAVTLPPDAWQSFAGADGRWWVLGSATEPAAGTDHGFPVQRFAILRAR